MHDKALVQAHQVADEGLLQQIIANGDTGCRQAGVVNGIVDECRVHDDIAVVGQKQIGAAGFELFDACVGHTISGPVDRMVDIHLDFVLQGRNTFDVGELAAQAMSYKRFEQPAEGAGKAREAEVGEDIEERRITEQPGQNGRDFSVVVRSDGIEFAHHALLLETARVIVKALV
ncbi:hypothetical protein D9M71_82600 [compost metagenome]